MEFFGGIGFKGTSNITPHAARATCFYRFSGGSDFLHFEALILCQSRLFLDRFCHFTPQQTQLSRLV